MTEQHVDVPQRATGLKVEAASPAEKSAGLGMLPAYQLATLRSVHQAFLTSFAQACGEELDLPVSALLVDLKPISLCAFLDPDYGHACLIPLVVDPSFGRAYLSLEPGFTFRILNMLLGAPQEQGVSARTSATEIELHIMRDFLGMLVGCLQKAWAQLKVDFAVPGDGDATPGSTKPDAMIVLQSAVKLGDYEEIFRLALPALLVRVAAKKADSPVPSLSRANPDLLAALGSATCNIEAVLEGSTILMSDLLRMEEGQILTVGSSSAARFECTVNGSRKFSGELIHSGVRQALQIESAL